MPPDWFDWITTMWRKVSQPSNVYSEKKYWEVKEPNIFTFHDYQHNFALRLETSQVKGFVKPILDIRNVNEVSLYIRFFALG